MMPPPKTRRFRAIVCAVDFSSHSAKALQHAVALAHSSGGDVHAVHVIDPLLSAAAAWGYASHMLEREGLADLTRFMVKTLGAEPAARVTAHVFVGTPATVLLAQARRLRADVIVLGTNARRGAPKLFFGSTTQAVLRRFDRAVLVIPPRCHAPLPGWPAGAIAAAVGTDLYRRAAIASAARMAEAFGAWLSVVPVTAAPRGSAAKRAGLILYPLPRAGRARMFRQGGAAYAFICASRVPVMVMRSGRQYGVVTAPRRAA
jgi:nucleotide-binding universal stress UspA family protein